MMIVGFLHAGDVTTDRPAPTINRLIAIPSEPPPPPPALPRAIKPVAPKPAGNPAPMFVAKEVVAPPPKIVIPTFQPLVPAPTANDGVAIKSGAAIVGQGSGAGGQGNGVGGGGTRPVMIQGVDYRQYPLALQDRWPSGKEVVVKLDISAKGRVTGCEVVDSFGDGWIDRKSCSLLRIRGRFKPATDGNGNKIASTFVYGLRGIR